MKLVEILIALMIAFGFGFFGSLQILIINKKDIYNRWVGKVGSQGLTTFDYVTTFGGLWVIKEIDYRALINSNPGDLELRKVLRIVYIVKWVSIITAILFAICAIILKILE
jgi:hypothetical protein